MKAEGDGGRRTRLLGVSEHCYRTAKFVRPHRAMTLLSCCVSTWTVAMAMADVPSYHPCPPLTTFEPLFCPVTPPLYKVHPNLLGFQHKTKTRRAVWGGT